VRFDNELNVELGNFQGSTVKGIIDEDDNYDHERYRGLSVEIIVYHYQYQNVFLKKSKVSCESL